MDNRTQPGTTRREFLGAAAAALFAGISITILGCDDGASTGSSPEAGDIAGEISNNHPSPHRAIIKKAQIDAAAAITLHIQGSSAHDHTVSLTAEDMDKLKQGGMVTVESSSTNDHSHSVMFM